MNGAYFNGVNSKVIVPNSKDLLNGDFCVYIEGDFRNYDGIFRVALGKTTWTSPGGYIYIRVTKGNTAIKLWNGSISKVLTGDAKEKAIFCVKRGSSGYLKIYSDVGQYEFNADIPAFMINDVVRIGQGVYGYRQHEGVLYKVAVWNSLLSEREIVNILNGQISSPNLYYDFTSGTALDFSGNGYHGQAENVKFIGGKSLSGAYFDGRSYIEAGNLNPGAQLIITGIEFAPYRKDKYQGLIGKWNSYALTTREWLVALFPHNLIKVYVADPSGSEHLEYTTEDGMQKLVAVIDATRGVMELYKDKILVATGSITKAIQSATTPLWVGQYGGGSKFYGIIKSTWVKWGQANNVLELFDNWGSGADLFYDFTSGSARDFSGNGNHGIIHGNVRFI